MSTEVSNDIIEDTNGGDEGKAPPADAPEKKGVIEDSGGNEPEGDDAEVEE